MFYDYPKTGQDTLTKIKLGTKERAEIHFNESSQAAK